MTDTDGYWTFPAASLDAAVGPRSRLFLLCNPHNPVGRAYTRDELAALAEVCERRDLVVCSDEIHCGLVLDPACRHVPFASLSEDAARRTITLMAASKTFNLPGLGTAFAIVADPELRRRIHRVMKGVIHRPTGFGIRATYAAYRDGEPWRLALVEALRTNLQTVQARIAAMPGLRMATLEATYLAWIDCRGSGLADPLAAFEAAGVPAGPVNSIGEALSHPQTLARGMVVELDHPVAGPTRALGTPITLSATPGRLSTLAPALGSHTVAVLRELGDAHWAFYRKAFGAPARPVDAGRR
jgi:bifunctional pyridoxal-dependent enzyme with beta-cystathionase and maltose regulon repressor activities